MSKKHLIALGGVAVILIGNFLPFVKGVVASMSLWGGDDGKIVLVAAILAAVAVLLRWNVVAIVMCLAAALTAVADMVDATNKKWDLGVGGYVIIAGAVVAIIAAALAIGDKRQASRDTQGEK